MNPIKHTHARLTLVTTTVRLYSFLSKGPRPAETLMQINIHDAALATGYGTNGTEFAWWEDISTANRDPS